MKFRVHGYAMIPVTAETTVEANSPEEAIEIAQRDFERDKIGLLVQNSEDYNAAFDWRPSAEQVMDTQPAAWSPASGLDGCTQCRFCEEYVRDNGAADTHMCGGG